MIAALQGRLSAYNDLHLTLKHVHWNVVGPNFIGVHEMLDPQIDLVRGYADEVAERIAAMGGAPRGTVGAIVKDRTWDDYSLDRDTVTAHLAALDLVYNGVVGEPAQGHRDRRRHRPGLGGPADRPGRRAGEVPVVHPRPPREHRWPPGPRGCDERGRGGRRGPRPLISPEVLRYVDTAALPRSGAPPSSCADRRVAPDRQRSGPTASVRHSCTHRMPWVISASRRCAIHAAIAAAPSARTSLSRTGNACCAFRAALAPIPRPTPSSSRPGHAC